MQDITIQQLRNDWLPAVYSPLNMISDNRQVERGYRVAEDGSLRFGALSFRGMQYSVVSDVPVPDLNALAIGEDGQPTQAFAQAFADGVMEGPDGSVEFRDQRQRTQTNPLADRNYATVAGGIGN